MTYTVRVTREDDQWLAEVAGLSGGHTFAGNLETLDRYVREVIVLMEDLPIDAEATLDLEWDLTAVSPLAVEARVLADERREVNRRLSEVKARTKDIASQLVADGWSVRDTAMAVGISPGRVVQILGPRESV